MFKGLLSSSIVGALGFLTVTCAQLYVFRFATQLIGLDGIGLVVLAQGVLFLARILDVGAGPNLTRRLAQSGCRPADPAVGTQLWGALLTVTAPTVALTGLLTIALLRWPSLLPVQSDDLGDILCAVLLGTVASSTIAVLSACLDGVGKLLWRGISTVFSGLLLAILGPYLVERLGAVGYALALPIATSAQLLLLLAVSGLSKVRLTPESAQSVLLATRAEFQNSTALNAIGLCRLLFEPLTKYLLAVFGTLELVATFDAVNKVVSAARTLIQTALQPLVFHFSKLELGGSDTRPRWIAVFLDRTAIYFAAGSICASPLISFALFGSSHLPDVAFITAILGVSAAVNLAGQFSYISLVARGEYRTILDIHLRMIFLNIVLSLALGVVLNGIGVVLGFALTFAFGGLALRASDPCLPVEADTKPLLGKDAVHVVLGAFFACFGSALLLSNRMTLQSSTTLSLLVALSLASSLAVLISFKR